MITVDGAADSQTEVAQIDFDPDDEFDAWVAAWCIAQQRLKTLRDMFLRMDLDNDPSLASNDAERFRALQFELTAAFVRELRSLVLSRFPRYDEQLANGPEEFVVKLGSEFQEMEAVLDTAIGDSDLASILKEHRHRTFHLPVKQNGKPEAKLKKALDRVANQDGTRLEVRTDGSIGGTELTFTRHIEAAMLAVELDIPLNDPDGRTLRERFEPMIRSVHDLVGRTDSITMQLLRLQLVRKGLARYVGDEQTNQPG